MFHKVFYDAAKDNLLSFGFKSNEYDNSDRGCIISAGAVAMLGQHLCWVSYARTAAKGIYARPALYRLLC